MKFPLTSLTFRVTPRLTVCRRLHAVSAPLVDVDTTESGLLGTPYIEGSMDLKKYKGTRFSVLSAFWAGHSPTHGGG
jgi:hypothetical protein